MPEYIAVNIDALEIGKSVKVGDLALEKLTLLDSVNNSIVSCVVTRAAKSAGSIEDSGEEDGEGEESEESTEE